MERPSPRQSNFAYGTDWEKEIAQYIRGKLGGHYDISPGSRGPADITNHTHADGLKPSMIILTQVKASRENSKAHPSVSATEKQKLIKKCEGLAASKKKKTIAMIALVKGSKVRFKIIGRCDPPALNAKLTDDDKRHDPTDQDDIIAKC